MSAKTTPAAVDQDRRAGALAGLDALREFERAIESLGDLTGVEFADARLALCRDLASKLGAVTPEQQGGVMVLAEYIHCVMAGYTPDVSPGGWRPTAAMTAEEYRGELDAMARYMEESNA